MFPAPTPKKERTSTQGGEGSPVTPLGRMRQKTRILPRKS